MWEFVTKRAREQRTIAHLLHARGTHSERRSEDGNSNQDNTETAKTIGERGRRPPTPTHTLTHTQTHTASGSSRRGAERRLSSARGPRTEREPARRRTPARRLPEAEALLVHHVEV